MWYDADIDAQDAAHGCTGRFLADASRAHEALTFGTILSGLGFRGVSSGLTGQLGRSHIAGSSPSASTTCCHLHHVAEAPHAAEYRHRRGIWRAASHDWLGIGYGHRSASRPIILFLIIFLWTPPHFWALALLPLTAIMSVCRCAHVTGYVCGPDATRTGRYWSITVILADVGGAFAGLCQAWAECLYAVAWLVFGC